MEEKNLKNNLGITLVALVVTIIVLLILAGVTINLVVGNNGIITRAREAKEKTEQAAREEQQGIAGLDSQIDELLGKVYNEKKKVNSPRLVSGMSPIKFTEPTESTMGNMHDTTADDTSWYDYNASKWANAKTQDGSMWVWIPRYAYKITYTNPADKSAGGSIDVKFLIGTTDEYYAEDGSRKTAQRQKTADQTIDTTVDYTVHPAFTNESNIGYANGGWDKELSGIWVAKFEAGFASGNNTTPVVRSNVKYTQKTSQVAKVEAGTESDSVQIARNWLDGTYGNNEILPNISYPVFQPLTYSMNYININDAYNISKAMTDSGNIYGIENSSADSHLMKNSEWGAVSYLSYSKYGTNGQEMAINNASLNSGDMKREQDTLGGTGVISAFSITGCTDGSKNNTTKFVKTNELNNANGNTATASGMMYVWNQRTGVNASSTLNMTGVYDMKGGAFERVASYVPNGNSNLKDYGASITYDGDTMKTASTKYTMVYPYDNSLDNTSLEENTSNLKVASEANYAKNMKIYGDGIREISTNGVESTSWTAQNSIFASLYYPFFIRGNAWSSKQTSGIFAFNSTGADSRYTQTFRPVVLPLG